MADGTLKIKVALDNDEFEVGTKELEAAARRTASKIEGIGDKAKIALNKQLNAFSDLNQQYARQEQKVEELKIKLKELSEQKVETDEYKILKNDMDKIGKSLDKVSATLKELDAQKDALNQKGLESEDIKKYQAKLNEVTNTYEELQAKMNADFENKYKNVLPISSKKTIEYLKTEDREYQKSLANLKRIESEIEKYGMLLEKAEDAQAKLNAKAQQDIDGKIIKAEQSMKSYRDSLIETRKKVKQLEDSGKAYQGVDPSQLESTKKALATAQEKLLSFENRLSTSADSLKIKMNELSNVEKIGNVSEKVKSKLKSLIKTVSKVTKVFGAFNRQSKKTENSFVKMLATSILFSAVFKAISIVTSGVRDGFSNLAQYSGDTNKSISELISSLKYLKNSFATAFAPILNVVSPYISYFIDKMAQAVNSVGAFMAALTGNGTVVKAVKVQHDYAKELKSTEKATKDVAKATNDYLSPLDEINKWQFDKSDNDVDISSVTPSDMFETVQIDSSIVNMAKKIRELIEAEDWEGIGNFIAQKINGIVLKINDAISWDNVGPQILFFVNVFTSTFNSLIDGIDWVMLGTMAGNGINTIVYMILAFILGIDWALLATAFASGLNGCIGTIDWTALGNLIGTYFMIPWNMLLAFVTKLDWISLGLSFANGINGALREVNEGTIGAAISRLVIGILTMLLTTAQNTNWTLLGQKITGLLAAIDWAGIGTTLFGAGQELLEGLLEAFKQLPDWLIALVGTVAIILGGIPAAVAIAAGLVIANWDKIQPYFQGFLDWFNKIFTTNWRDSLGITGFRIDYICRGILESINGVKKVFEGLVQFIAGVFTGDWKRAFEGLEKISNGFMRFMWGLPIGIANESIEILNGLIKTITNFFNFLFSNLNGARIKIPDWVPIWGGKEFSLNLPTFQVHQIPYLASGAVIPPRSEFLAVLGDQKRGTNIETPEALLRQIMREEMQSNNRQGNITYRFYGQINRRTLFEEIIEEAKMRQSQTGENPFELA